MIAAFILFLKLLLQHQTFLKSFAVTGGFALTRVLNAADIFLFPNSAIAHQRGASLTHQTSNMEILLKTFPHGCHETNNTQS